MKKHVGVAEFKFGTRPDVLTIIGLGSCVAVALYHEPSSTGGLAHIMLPESWGRPGEKAGKYADTAVKAMVRQMRSKVGEDGKIVAKLAGGAQMFRATRSFNIGQRNVQAAKKALEDLGIEVIAEDIGQNHGRTIEFYTENGRIKIKSVHGKKMI